jgi:NADH-quinone oxidoreductase subunit J
MTVEVVAFWSLAVVLVGSALAVVLTKNLFHSVLWLALALVGTAGIFLSLEAEFLAAVQVLLYAGGVVTVVVFAIVVTEQLIGERLSQTSRRVALGAATSAGVLAGILSTIAGAPLADSRPAMPLDLTQELGLSVLTRYVLPFELLAVLLLVALIGATYFARPED